MISHDQSWIIGPQSEPKNFNESEVHGDLNLIEETFAQL